MTGNSFFSAFPSSFATVFSVLLFVSSVLSVVVDTEVELVVSAAEGVDFLDSEAIRITRAVIKEIAINLHTLHNQHEGGKTAMRYYQTWNCKNAAQPRNNHMNRHNSRDYAVYDRLTRNNS